VPPSPEDAAPVVARLRAAGCVFAEDEAAALLAEATGPASLAALVDRRVAGEPLELVLGWAGFYGLRIAVEPGVFVPRQRTATSSWRELACVKHSRTRTLAAVSASRNALS